MHATSLPYTAATPSPADSAEASASNPFLAASGWSVPLDKLTVQWVQQQYHLSAHDASIMHREIDGRCKGIVQLRVPEDLDEVTAIESQGLREYVGLGFLVGNIYLLSAAHIVPDLSTLYTTEFHFAYLGSSAFTIPSSADDGREGWFLHGESTQQPPGTSLDHIDLVLIRLPKLAEHNMSNFGCSPVWAQDVLQSQDAQLFWIHFSLDDSEKLMVSSAGNVQYVDAKGDPLHQQQGVNSRHLICEGDMQQGMSSSCLLGVIPKPCTAAVIGMLLGKAAIKGTLRALGPALMLECLEAICKLMLAEEGIGDVQTALNSLNRLRSALCIECEGVIPYKKELILGHCANSTKSTGRRVVVSLVIALWKYASIEDPQQRSNVVCAHRNKWFRGIVKSLKVDEVFRKAALDSARIDLQSAAPGMAALAVQIDVKESGNTSNVLAHTILTARKVYGGRCIRRLLWTDAMARP